MTSLTLRIITLSETLVGTGEGWGSTIDSDVVFDIYGLPFIPSKRIKGCLRESALEVAEMFGKGGITPDWQDKVDLLFGRPGNRISAPLRFGNLYLKDYEKEREWFEWAIQEYPSLISRDMVLSAFTNIRQQTTIDKTGVAKRNSLRTARVLKRGLTFSGVIEADDATVDGDALLLGALNLRYIGTKRNRGFGHIKCEILDSTGKDLGNAILGKFEKVED